MNINTKFSLNDEVFLIRNTPVKYYEKCSACSGDGVITLNNGKSSICPECYGRKAFERHKQSKWQVTDKLTIGQVRAEITNIESYGMFDNVGHYADGNTESKIQYMAYETGVGSGSLHNEETLFGTEDEAIAECIKRNQE